MTLWHELENVTPAHWNISTRENGGSEVGGRAVSPNEQYRWTVLRHPGSKRAPWEVIGEAVDPRTGEWREVLHFDESSRYDAVSSVGAFTPDLVGRSSEEPPAPGLFDQLG